MKDARMKITQMEETCFVNLPKGDMSRFKKSFNGM